ncbi:MAG TPA: hypothetical protein VMT42_03100 [candidate division Zixibacteria bacterium]|nr:hypothetical protein [candidate division Zixibacteria bacterium]
MDPNIHNTLKREGGGTQWLKNQRINLSPATVHKRITSIADKFSLDTQKIRFELILQLKTLAEMAQQKAHDTHPTETQTKQDWTRLAAYISQVINGISKTYDETEINTELQDLENKVAQLTKEDETTSDKR